MKYFSDIVTRSAVPLLLAVLTQAAGGLCCMLGHCVKGRRLCTFIAGVLFIISGKFLKVYDDKFNRFFFFKIVNLKKAIHCDNLTDCENIVNKIILISLFQVS